MTPALLFAASFAVVFALGIQQHNVTHGHRVAAFITSVLIGVMTLVQLKLLPGPTTWLDIGAYLVGSAFGIVGSMWAHPRVLRLLVPSSPALHAERLAEQVRLAHKIADEAARTDIECHCVPMSMGNYIWYDTAELQSDLDEGSDVPEYVERARRYLRMRGRIVEHPTQAALVRFAS